MVGSPPSKLRSENKYTNCYGQLIVGSVPFPAMLAFDSVLRQRAFHGFGLAPWLATWLTRFSQRTIN